MLCGASDKWYFSDSNFELIRNMMHICYSGYSASWTNWNLFICNSASVSAPFFFFFVSGFLMPLTWTSKSQVLTLPRIVTDNTWQSPPVNSYIEGLTCSRQRTGGGALASGSWGNQLIRNPSYKQNKFYPKINRMCIQCS